MDRNKTNTRTFSRKKLSETARNATKDRFENDGFVFRKGKRGWIVENQDVSLFLSWEEIEGWGP